jgi:hypothetical protein
VFGTTIDPAEGDHKNHKAEHKIHKYSLGVDKYSLGFRSLTAIYFVPFVFYSVIFVVKYLSVSQSLSTLNSFLTSNKPETPLALILAISLSPLFATTPFNVSLPRLMMM